MKTEISDTNIDWEKNQSQTIDLLRFPLVICVVFIHMFPYITLVTNMDFPMLSSHGIYNILGIIFSNVLPSIAVPSFFLFSGYLFFANFKDWSWNGYKEKLRRRVKSLLIPYLLWNLIPIIMDLIRQIILAIKNNSYNFTNLCIPKISVMQLFIENCRINTNLNLCGGTTYMSYPLNLSLWFLRDLIIVCILTPIIYYLIKKTRLGIILIFALGYIINITIPIPGFSFVSLFFFSLGAYFAINGINIAKFSRRYSTFCIPISIVLLIVCTFTLNRYLLDIFIIIGIFAAFAIASNLIEKYNVKPNTFLVKSSFFIYASHFIDVLIWETPVSFCKKLLGRFVIGNETYIQQCASYLLAPFLAIGICLLGYYLLSRFMPKLCGILCGNR